MKKLIAICFILCGLLSNIYSVPQNVEFGTTATASDSIHIKVDEMPEFPGGQNAMLQFISKNIQYPKFAKERGIQGRVVVKFVVQKDGSISNVEVMRSVDEHLDAEVVRLVKSMPNWKPGKHNGEVVNVQYVLPVVFKLDEKTKKKKR